VHELRFLDLGHGPDHFGLVGVAVKTKAVAGAVKIIGIGLEMRGIELSVLLIKLHQEIDVAFKLDALTV
jgi:hypothetical protein